MVSEIREWAVRFYNELYESEYVEYEELSVSFYAGLPKLQEESRAVLERPLQCIPQFLFSQSMESEKKLLGSMGSPLGLYSLLEDTG